MTKPIYMKSSVLSVAVISLLLVGCGGGGGSSGHHSGNSGVSNTTSTTTTTTPVTTQTPPPATTSTTNTTTTTTPITTTGSTTPSTSNAQNTDKYSEANKAVLAKLNERRTNCGFGELIFNKELVNAASNHANYLLYMNKYSDQDFQGHHEQKVDSYSGTNNPYYTGYDIVQRVNTDSNIGRDAIPVKYGNGSVGEDLSHLTFPDSILNEYGDKQIALDSLNGLLAAPYHIASLVDPSFTEAGVSYGRDKVKNPVDNFIHNSVLELMLATPITQGTSINTPNEVLSYPCKDTIETDYKLTNEYPNPFGNTRNLTDNPIGQPIYIMGNTTSTIQVTDYKMTDAAGESIELKALTSANDPHHILKSHQVILMPLSPLQPNQLYRVTYDVSVNGGREQNKSLTFQTKK